MERRIVYCPLLQRNIDNCDDCFIIASVAEDSCPDSYAPKELFEIENWKEICNQCEYNLMYK